MSSYLMAEQRVVKREMSSMIENQLSWAVLWCCAKYPESVLRCFLANLQNASEPPLLTQLPIPILNFCYKLLSGRMDVKRTRAAGTGDRAQRTIVQLTKNELRVLSFLFADKRVKIGSEPSLMDVIAFANLAHLYFLSSEMQHPLRDTVNELFDNSVGLIMRMRDRVFPGWKKLIALELAAHPIKQIIYKEYEEIKKPLPAKKAPRADAPETSKQDEKEKDQEKEPEEVNGKTEKEK